MRILVIDGVPHVVIPQGWQSMQAGIYAHLRPLDDRPEDREAREAWERYCFDKPQSSWEQEKDGLYELVEEHRPICPISNPDCAMMVCACEGGWPRKTLRRLR